MQLPIQGEKGTSRRGFTRVDLLVLLGTVLILAVMLRPVWGRSSEGGQHLVCVANLKALLQAVGFYAMDHRDYLPYPNWGNNIADGPGWLYCPTNGMPPDLTRFYTNPAAAYQSGALWPYMRRMDSYVCPTDQPNATLNKYWSQRANKLSTYVMNGAACKFGGLSLKKPNTYPLRMLKPGDFTFWEPDEGLMDGGVPIGAFAYNDASAYPFKTEGMAARHGLAGNVGCLDGSVRSTTRSEFNQYQSMYPGPLWCVPDSPNGQ